MQACESCIGLPKILEKQVTHAWLCGKSAPSVAICLGCRSFWRVVVFVGGVGTGGVGTCLHANLGIVRLPAMSFLLILCEVTFNVEEDCCQCFQPFIAEAHLNTLLGVDIQGLACKVINNLQKQNPDSHSLAGRCCICCLTSEQEVMTQLPDCPAPAGSSSSAAESLASSTEKQLPASELAGVPMKGWAGFGPGPSP